jgi:hypothetical protein
MKLKFEIDLEMKNNENRNLRMTFSKNPTLKKKPPPVTGPNIVFLGKKIKIEKFHSGK